MIQIILETSFKNALFVLNQIPEFDETFTHEKLQRRLDDTMLILVAYLNNKAIGCKIAYRRFNDNSLYSWLGGVVPEFRKQGVATLLNQKMEKLAKEKGYKSISFKTRNKFKAMLQFAIKNGYNIVDFETKQSIPENRIVLNKRI